MWFCCTFLMKEDIDTFSNSARTWHFRAFWELFKWSEIDPKRRGKVGGKDQFNIKKKYHFITTDSQPTEVNCTIKSNSYKLNSQQMFIFLNTNLCFKDILLNVLTAQNSCSQVLENISAWEYFTSAGCLEDYLDKHKPTTVSVYSYIVLCDSFL